MAKRIFLVESQAWDKWSTKVLVNISKTLATRFSQNPSVLPCYTLTGYIPVTVAECG